MARMSDNNGTSASQIFSMISHHYNNNNNFSVNEISSIFQTLFRELEQGTINNRSSNNSNFGQSPRMSQNQRNNPHLT